MSTLIQLCVASVLLLFRTAGKVSSQQSVLYFFYQRAAYPRDCKEALDSCHYQRLSGVYVVKPDGYHRPFEVYCDNKLDSGGWTVILRRHDGSVTFQRDWLDYKGGFGFLSQELWIGHEKLSFLTNQKIYELRIDVTYSDDTSTYALYSLFRISDDFSNYRLSTVGLYSGTLNITECPVNMEYGTCLCQSPCGDFQDCQPCPQNEACFCPNGFYLKGTDCVTEEECGCFIDDVSLREGQSFIAPGCSKRCFCINGRLSCDFNYRCDPNAACLQQNNIYQCACSPGFTSSGDICVSIFSTNEIYGTCECERSCGNPQVCTPCSVQGQQCYCPAGFYLQTQGCIRQEECNCFTEGDIVPEGQTYISPGCSKRCFCINGQLLCDDSYRCDTNATCFEQNNMYQCTCNEGFTSSGDTCVSICSANEMYGACNCERSCGNPQVCTPCSTQGERCYCPNGFYLQGHDCVPDYECGCYIDGTIVPNSGTYVDSECSQQCTCNNGQLNCDSYECSPNAVCRVENDVRKCYCIEDFEGDGETCTPTMTYTDCYDAYQAGERQDGVYSILPSGWTGPPFDVPCNMSIDGAGWTVLQRRVDGSEDFEHNWNDYKNGFGVLGGELWLGNDKIHVITNQKDYKLRMDMVNLNGNAYFAKYSLFRIKNEDSNYQLELGNFDLASTGFDNMDFHRDQFFSTPDRDNDAWSSINCASITRSAWWYNDCNLCDFNRPLFGSSVNNLSPYWAYLPGSLYLMYTDIKIRPV